MTRLRARITKHLLATAVIVLLMLATQANSQDIHAPASGKTSALEKELLSASPKARSSQGVQPQSSLSTLSSKPQVTLKKASRNPNLGDAMRTANSVMSVLKAKGLKTAKNSPGSAVTPKMAESLLSSLEAQLSTNLQVDLVSLRSISLDKKVKIRFDQGSKIREVRGRFQQKDGESNPERAAESFLNKHQVLFGIDRDTQFLKSKQCIENICRVILKRRHKDLEVWGGDVVVTIVAGEVRSVLGDFEANDLLVSSTPLLADDTIKKVVLDHLKYEELSLSEPITITRGISNFSSQRIVVYRATASFTSGESYDVYVDERNSRVVNVVSRFYNAFTDSQGSDLAGNVQTFRSETFNGGYRMYDDSFPANGVTAVGTFNGTADQIFEVTSPSNISGWNPAAVSALVNAKKTHEYYLNQHGRNGLDGSGSGTRSFVDFGDSPVSATYMGNSVIRYGSGDGVIASNLAEAEDIAGHEMTHGVISNTSALVYQYQSGALDESFSDYFGSLIEGKNWLIGEDVWLAAPGYLRSMSNPEATDQPSHMSEYQSLPLEVDAGGVHINSGIPNRALYLLTEGLTQEGLGTSIDVAKAEKIVYQSMTTLPTNASFLDAGLSLAETASALYGDGGVEHRAVIDAFYQVGIDLSSTAPPVEPIPPQSGETNFVTFLSPSSEGSYQDVFLQIFDNDFLGFSAELVFQVNSYQASRKRPTLSADEVGNAFLFYYAIDNSLVGVDLGTFENTIIEPASDIQTGVLSPDLSAYVVTYQDLGVISVCTLATTQCTPYVITGPDYSEDGSGGDLAQIVDVVRFDPTGRRLAFDYATCRVNTSGGCNTTWSIGILDLSTGIILHPLLGQPEGVQIGNPAFSNLTDRYLTFDLIDSRDVSVNGRADSMVLVLDTYEKELFAIVDPDGGSNQGSALGFPSFNADDSAIVFQATLPNAAADYQLMYLAELSNYQSNGNYPNLNPYIGSLPFSAPAVNNPPVSVLQLSSTALNFGSIPLVGQHSMDLCVINTSSTVISLNTVSPDSAYLSTNINPAVLTGGYQICGQVFVDSSQLTPGSSFSGAVIFQNDGAATLGASISGIVAALSPPSPPTITSIESGDEEILVRLSAAGDGGSAISGYTATCTDGTDEYTGTSTTSRITVSGLTNGVSYTCSVTATNEAGTSTASATSPPVTPEEALAVGLPIWLLYEAAKPASP